jgi:putative phosphoribosyl transferase
VEVLRAGPLFADRVEAGRVLARRLEGERTDAVVVGLARGGVVVAAEVAAALALPLDVLAVRKVRHPWQPEYAIGAVTPQDGVYVRARDGLTEAQLEAAVELAKEQARGLDARLHASAPSLDLEGATCILVDDGLATGATMIAAARWARRRGAARVVAAVPVGASDSLHVLAAETDAVVCPYPLARFSAVGVWYGSFAQVGDDDVRQLLLAQRPAEAPAP